MFKRTLTFLGMPEYNKKKEVEICDFRYSKGPVNERPFENWFR